MSVIFKMNLRTLIFEILLFWICSSVDSAVIRYRDEYRCNWVPECFYTMENPGVCNIWYPYQSCDFVKVPYDDSTPFVPTPKPPLKHSAEEFISGETIVDHSRREEIDMKEIETNARFLGPKTLNNHYEIASRFNGEDTDDSFPNFKSSLFNSNVDPSLFSPNNDADIYLDYYDDDDDDDVYTYDDGEYEIPNISNDINESGENVQTDDNDSSRTLSEMIDHIFQGARDSKGDYIDNETYDLQTGNDLPVETGDENLNNIDDGYNSVDGFVDPSDRFLSGYNPTDNNLSPGLPKDDFTGNSNEVRQNGFDVSLNSIDKAVDIDNELLDGGNTVYGDNHLVEEKNNNINDEQLKTEEKTSPFIKKIIDAPIHCPDGWKIDATGKCREQWA